MEESNAHLSLVTLGVSDLQRSIAFYETLGFQRKGKAFDGIGFFQAGAWRLLCGRRMNSPKMRTSHLKAWRILSVALRSPGTAILNLTSMPLLGWPIVPAPSSVSRHEMCSGAVTAVISP